MALATQCPHCQTTFRVAIDQLKLRGGIVRCGHCQEIFDGNACIVDLSQREAAAAATPEQAPAPVYEIDLTHTLDPHGILPAPEAAPTPAPTAAPTPPPGLPEFSLDLPDDAGEPVGDSIPRFAELLNRELDARSVVPDSSDPLLPPASSAIQLDLEPAWPTAAPTRAPFSAWKPGVDLNPPTPAPAPEPEQEVPAAPPLTRDEADTRIEPSLDLPPPPATPAHAARLDLVVGDDEEEEPEFVKRGRADEQRGKWRTLGLSLGSLLLVLLLGGQALLHWRHQLAAHYPAMKAPLSQLCAGLGCRIELPAQISVLSIETGELQTLAGSVHSYSTLLRNQSALSQAWPALELRLRDDKRQLLLRRVLYPKDYLPAGTDIAKGFTARSEQPVLLHFDLGSLVAAGYDVGLFYP